MPFSILGLGTVVVDHQVRLQFLPEPDTKAEIISDSYQVGGPVPTALALLSLFGTKTSFIGRWSTDEQGHIIKSDLKQSDIDTQFAVVKPEARSGFAHVWVEAETGRRSIAAYRGSHVVQLEDLKGINWTDYHALHLDGWSTQAAIVAAKKIKAAGGRVSLDLGSRKSDLSDLLGSVDAVNCPLNLIKKLYPNENLEQASIRLIDMGVSELTVTNGKFGAWLIDADGINYQKAFSVKSIDTNGAGDVFCGAMIYGSMMEWKPDRRLRFAAAAAAIKCCNIGNRSALPNLQQIESFLRQKS
ncbi:MAG: carbohydrate kinase family protein [Verrucomicrobiota bacterium]|nr:carbohydrate kinase family protein [Verrucomicrobiota bacterium]